MDVGIAGAGLDGGVSGDLAVRVDTEDGGLLLAAIDGLGHGPAAAEAARAAERVLRGRADLPLDELFRKCHEAMVKTRGAVMTVARVDPHGALEWVGVGNVEARLLRAAPGAAGSESPVLFGGVLGHQIRRIRPSRLQLERGDVLLMATDGVRADFSTGASVRGSAQAIADRVLSASSRGSDDALVLVARWLGTGA